MVKARATVAERLSDQLPATSADSAFHHPVTGACAKFSRTPQNDFGERNILIAKVFRRMMKMTLPGFHGRPPVWVRMRWSLHAKIANVQLPGPERGKPALDDRRCPATTHMVRRWLPLPGMDLAASARGFLAMPPLHRPLERKPCRVPRVCNAAAEGRTATPS